MNIKTIKSVVVTIYFVMMLFVVAYLVTDFGYTYPDALFISSTYLPTVVLVHALTGGFNTKSRVNVVGALLAIVGVFILQMLLITLANYALHRLSYGITMPEIVINPILVFLIFMLYYLPFRIINERCFKQSRADIEERKVEFISNRKKVNIYVREILYIESRDTEVWLHKVGGESYRSRTNISSWQREMGADFVRIHRSYLINSDLVDSVQREEITLMGGVKLSISRSYQQSIEGLLSSKI